MTDARITELQPLLPRCLLPDWIRLGSRLAVFGTAELAQFLARTGSHRRLV